MKFNGGSKYGLHPALPAGDHTASLGSGRNGARIQETSRSWATPSRGACRLERGTPGRAQVSEAIIGHPHRYVNPSHCPLTPMCATPYDAAHRLQAPQRPADILTWRPKSLAILDRRTALFVLAAVAATALLRPGDARA